METCHSAAGPTNFTSSGGGEDDSMNLLRNPQKSLSSDVQNLLEKHHVFKCFSVSQ